MTLKDWINLIHPIPDADFARLEAECIPRSFKKGEVLVEVGQVQREMYFVQTGVQMSFFEGRTRQHVVAFTYPPGASAIPDSFLTQQPSRHVLVCLADSEMLALSWESLQKLYDQSQSIERFFRKATEWLLAGTIARQVELLSLSMEDRFRAFTKRSPHLLQMVPHKYIASYLDMDPTNFSNLFNSLKI